MAMRVQTTKSKKTTSGSRSANRASAGYAGDSYHDEGSDDEGAISLAAIKNQYKKGGPSQKSEYFVLYFRTEKTRFAIVYKKILLTTFFDLDTFS